PAYARMTRRLFWLQNRPETRCSAQVRPTILTQSYGNFGLGGDHADREGFEAVGEVRPDPARLAGQLEPGHPPGQRREHDPHLEPAQVGAHAQVRPAPAEAQVPGWRARDVAGVRVCL